MKKNWKTTLFGLLMAFGLAMGQDPIKSAIPSSVSNFAGLATAVFAALLGKHAADATPAG